jgi:hypothetical protein
MLQIVVLVSFGKLSRRRREGCMVLVPMTFELSVQKFLSIKLISSPKISEKLELCLLGCCWKDLDEQDLMEFIW